MSTKAYDDLLDKGVKPLPEGMWFDISVEGITLNIRVMAPYDPLFDKNRHNPSFIIDYWLDRFLLRRPRKVCGSSLYIGYSGIDEDGVVGIATKLSMEASRLYEAENVMRKYAGRNP